MLINILMVAAGLGFLAYAGDRLIDFASATAEKARMTKAVIGLTIVAAGTSMPELFVSVTAALKGSSDIAIGNVIGSNIFNIAGILGICAAIAAVEVHNQTIRFDYPFCLLVSVLALLLFRDGMLDRMESGAFVAGMIGFIGYSVWVARSEINARDQKEVEILVPEEADVLRKRPLWFLIGGITLSFVGLTVGARLLLEGSVGIARLAGMSERVIGLTIVAAGTSLPELVASIAATLKKHYDMAVTNIIGSNVFNILFILGVSGIITPIPVSEKAVRIDGLVMIGVTVLFLPLAYWTRRITRPGGIVLLAVLVAYTGWLLVNP